MADEEDTSCMEGARRKRQRSDAPGSRPLSTGSGSAPVCPSPRVTETDLRAALKCVRSNQEAYHQGVWRREPWRVRSYHWLDTYEVADDAGESIDHEILRRGMMTTLVGSQEAVRLPEVLSDDSPASVALAKLPEPLILGQDIKECCTWGIDSYTRRMLFDALGFCRELVAGAEDEEVLSRVKQEFIEERLLVTLNKLEASGWDVFQAVETIQEEARASGNDVEKTTASRLLQIMERMEFAAGDEERMIVNKDGDKVVDPKKRIYFRAHPKGQGVLCMRPGGLPPGTFVAEYLGEVYSPWRWFERQDVIKKRNPDAALPDFYNISLERPQDDDMGYGVMFVEGANRGNFASRLCHSCSPNCRTISMTAGGKISNGMFTLRHINVGEELTWDYACVTESDKEYKAAVCLCGTCSCRGSFLYYANSSVFQEIVNRDHNWLDRNAILIRSCVEKPTVEDHELLRKHGLKDHALRFDPKSNKMIPDWLIKWAALVLEFIEHEAQELPAALVRMSEANPELGFNYTLPKAKIEAIGVKANRVHNLVVTLDKAKYFLRKQPSDMQGPPLRLLSDKEVLEHLWTGDDSIAKKAVEIVESIENPLKKGTSKKRSATCMSNGDKPAGNPSSVLSRLKFCHRNRKVTSVKDGLEGLREMAKLLSDSGEQVHAALHDMLCLKAASRKLFTVNKYRSVSSTPVKLSEQDVPMVSSAAVSAAGSTTTAAVETTSQKEGALAASVLSNGGTGANDTSASSSGANGTSANDAAASGTGANGAKRKKPSPRNVVAKQYSPEFLWGQLVAWYKQTIYNPSASLSADRRGTISLPSIDSCSVPEAISGTYAKKQRAHMINMLQNRPETMWPTGTIWSFKNTAKVYGSPMLDQALRRSCKRKDDGKMRGLLFCLQSTFGYKPPLEKDEHAKMDKGEQKKNAKKRQKVDVKKSEDNPEGCLIREISVHGDEAEPTIIKLKFNSCLGSTQKQELQSLPPSPPKQVQQQLPPPVVVVSHPGTSQSTESATPAKAARSREQSCAESCSAVDLANPGALVAPTPWECQADNALAARGAEGA
eukprot:evm.model.scf_335EXC.9 EVM.evm.TU.scf_335EXC.9   scf_335EXC:53090-63556(+)